MTNDRTDRPHPDDPPVVASPGDSDAPDRPDEDTIYPDRQGTPGDPATNETDAADDADAER